MKEMKTNLEGKVRNLPHFRSEALLPLFEAVVNAIQAIEERGIGQDGAIDIEVERSGQGVLGANDLRPIVGFSITDNGIGFNSVNFESFCTSDSTYKQSKGGKGIGRFLWLKAFDSVSVTSVYADGKSRMERRFTFTAKKGIDDTPLKQTDSMQKTTVYLKGFKKEYKNLSSAYKTPNKIAQRILEHCLSYFISGGMPRIILRDGDETIILNEIYDKDISTHVFPQEITLKNHLFTFNHLKLFGTHEKMHNIVLCADRREVKPVSLQKALGTSSQLDDGENGRFTYALYVSSSYLNEYADHYRLDFDIPEDPPLGELENYVSFDDIISTVTQAAKDYLRPHLAKNLAIKQEAITRYIQNENPALRAVAHYCPEVYDELETNSSDERIDEVLYRFKGKAEYAIRKRSNELLRTQTNSLAEIDVAYAKLTAEITDFQKDNLVHYLCDRKRIIDILDKKLEINKQDGKYPNEDIIHDIIFPRKTNTNEISFEDHNLWLIDEYLTFHAFAVSEKPLYEIVASESAERPDVVSFAEVGDDRVARAVSILEFKKPQRKTFDEDPVKQLYRYLRQIRDSKSVKLPNGRELHVSTETRFYCYAICDMTVAVKEFAENGSYAKLANEFGYYTYNRNLNAHTEILDFDKIVIDATRRHKAFFQKLGID